MPNKTYRFTLDFSEEIYEVLGHLKTKLSSQNEAEVICRAIGDLNYLVSQQEEGWVVVLEKGNVRKEIIKL